MLKKKLKSFLVRILEQHPNDSEVILVNDFSEDHTDKLLTKLQQSYKNLIHYKVKENHPGKKQALNEGISQAKNDWLLLTDSDCYPSSQYWKHMMLDKAIQQKKEIVLGYSPYKMDGTILSLWMHFESWIVAVQYLSYALLGMPYMGVGRNLLVKKDLFSLDVLIKHQDLLSGDDDLSINQIANRENTGICIDPSSFIYTPSLKSYKEYINQKRRQFSTAHRYQLSHKILLSLYSFSQILFYPLVILLCFSNFKLGLILLTLRSLAVLSTAKRLIKKLRAQFSLFQFLILDFCQTLFYLFFSFAVLFPKKDIWK